MMMTITKGKGQLWAIGKILGETVAFTLNGDTLIRGPVGHVRVGQKFFCGQVLIIGNDVTTVVGNPYLQGIFLHVEVVDRIYCPPVRSFRKLRRKRYEKAFSTRTQVTRIRTLAICFHPKGYGHLRKEGMEHKKMLSKMGEALEPKMGSINGHVPGKQNVRSVHSDPGLMSSRGTADADSATKLLSTGVEMGKRKFRRQGREVRRKQYFRRKLASEANQRKNGAPETDRRWVG